jgi:hypothetical protein
MTILVVMITLVPHITVCCVYMNWLEVFHSTDLFYSSNNILITLFQFVKNFIKLSLIINCHFLCNDMAFIAELSLFQK